MRQQRSLYTALRHKPMYANWDAIWLSVPSEIRSHIYNAFRPDEINDICGSMFVELFS